MILGVVAGAHGLRGELRVKLFGDGPEGLRRMPEVELAHGLDDAAARRCRVLRTATGRSGEVRLALEGVDDREGAEALRGRQVIGDAQYLEPLEPGEYRWFELIGCQVFAAGAEEAPPVGTVREIWETGAHDVLVVEDEEGQRHLLPAAKAFLVSVDPGGRRIVYEVIPGLLDGPA